MALPDTQDRLNLGDVLLVGGTFFHDAKLVLKNGVSFPVSVDITISKRGIAFSRVRLKESLQKGNIKEPS